MNASDAVRVFRRVVREWSALAYDRVFAAEAAKAIRVLEKALRPAGNGYEELYNLYCPQCGSAEDVSVSVTCPIRVVKDDTSSEAEALEEHTRFSDDAPSSCGICGYVGKAKEFLDG